MTPFGTRQCQRQRPIVVFVRVVFLGLATQQKQSCVHAFSSSLPRSASPRRTQATPSRPFSKLERVMIFSDKSTPSESQDQDDCGDECEIDWDAMPSWEDQDEQTEVPSPSASVPFDEEDDDDDDDEPLEIAPRKGPSVEQRRIHMEMQWQLTEASQECVVEEPETCGSEKCTDCHGRGWSNCRFCHGTAVLKLDRAMPMVAPQPTTMAGSVSLTSSSPTSITAARTKFMLPASFSACKICQQGVETCRTCKGSGWVAAWTKIPNNRNNERDDPLLP